LTREREDLCLIGGPLRECFAKTYACVREVAELSLSGLAEALRDAVFLNA
jgi:hypothetical protein